jgi:hypothetical protein
MTVFLLLCFLIFLCWPRRRVRMVALPSQEIVIKQYVLHYHIINRR